jgi:hypothetical protein
MGPQHCDLTLHSVQDYRNWLWRIPFFWVLVYCTVFEYYYFFRTLRTLYYPADFWLTCDIGTSQTKGLPLEQTNKLFDGQLAKVHYRPTGRAAEAKRKASERLTGRWPPVELLCVSKISNEDSVVEPRRLCCGLPPHGQVTRRCGGGGFPTTSSYCTIFCRRTVHYVACT